MALAKFDRRGIYTPNELAKISEEFHRSAAINESAADREARAEALLQKWDNRQPDKSLQNSEEAHHEERPDT
jgi:hypothetical protein